MPIVVGVRGFFDHNDGLRGASKVDSHLTQLTLGPDPCRRMLCNRDLWAA